MSKHTDKYMSKYMAKYAPKKVGDKMIITCMKYENLFLTAILLSVMYDLLLSIFFISKDLLWALYILGLISVLAAFGGWCLENTKYVIAPDYFEIKHGPFSKKIQFDQIASYSSTTGNVLFLYLVDGKEIKIEYEYMFFEAERRFGEVIKRKNIPEKAYSDCQNFKMHRKRLDAIFGIVFFGGILVFCDYMFFDYIYWGVQPWYVDSFDYNIFEILFLIMISLMFNFLLLSAIFPLTYTIYIHDKCIDVKNLGIPIKTLNVDEISDYHSHYVTHRGSKGASWKVEELTLNMKKGELGLFFPTISRQYSDYERLIGYLRANGIPTSSELETRNAPKKPKAKKINENQNKINLKKRRRRHTL